MTCLGCFQLQGRFFPAATVAPIWAPVLLMGGASTSEANQLAVHTSAPQQQVQRSECALSFVAFIGNFIRKRKNKRTNPNETIESSPKGWHVQQLLEGYCISLLPLLKVRVSFLLVVLVFHSLSQENQIHSPAADGPTIWLSGLKRQIRMR